jgi:glucosamine-6-phosphate deaminase
LSFNVEVLPPSVWADAVAESWLGLLADDPEIRMSLPTGATPRPVYREVASRGIDLARTEVFLLDEFAGLPPDSPARCDRMLRTGLLELLDRPPAVVRTFDMASTDLTAMCSRYEAEIGESGLDLTLLGLGGNGHIGLNEPGSEANTRTRVVELGRATSEAARAYGMSGPVPTRGVTMGVGTLLESSVIWLLVTGTYKADILARVVNGPIDASVPASFLREHPDTIVYADEAAAEKL